jgi:hypothetical protein
MSDGKTGTPGWVWILVAVGGLFVVLSIAAPLAIYGVRKYMVNAKRAEATAVLAAWGDGLVRCGEADKLPPSSSPVPASFAAVAAKKYQSAPTEWSEPAHTCARFSMSDPQYFQYTWELTAPGAGTLHARADFNGDGAADASLDMQVLCDAGKCQRAALSDASGVAVSGSSPSGSGTSPGEILSMILLGASFLVLTVSGIGLIIAAFGESVSWGLVSLFVPCGRLLFLVNHWERGKKLFFWQLGGWGGLVIGALLMLAFGDLTSPSARASSLGVSPAGSIRRASSPPPVPIPALDGASVDLSTVMGRARKLANAWQPEAALLGVEASLVGGKIQTQDGGSAKVTFGPSPFGTDQARSGLFVVTYDKSGINGAPTKGTPGKVLPEPMCAPEGVLPRLDDQLKGSPITLRYGLDGSQRPAWLVSLPGDPKPLRAFAPDDCAPRGTFIARPKR